MSFISAIRGFRNLLNLQVLESSAFYQEFHKQLNQKRWCKPVLDYAESSTKVNRVYLVSGLLLMITLSLLWEFGIVLICESVGVLYPAFGTLKLLEKPNTQACQRWLIYWLIHAGLNFAEIFFFFLYWIPGYWILKCMFLMSCYAPVERNGSDLLYERFIKPMFQKNKEVINNALQQAARTVHTICPDSELLKDEIERVLAEENLTLLANTHPHKS